MSTPPLRFAGPTAALWNETESDCREGDERFAASYAAAASATFDGSLDVVSFNIQFGRRIDRVRRLFARIAELSRANVVLLQEMDPEGTDDLAAALGMNYVYYPATVHRVTGRHFGNAVLSRWPIVRDRKITLPHLSLRDRSPRAATCATVATPEGPVEVCSLHIATAFELLPNQRRAQMRAALHHLRGTPRVIMGGDFNSYRLGHLARAHAFEWATQRVGRTLSLFSVDHIFAHGLQVHRAGRVPETLEASDHVAVWARLVAR